MNTLEAFAGKVLLVEDSPETLAIIEAACAAMGFEVDTACDGSEGLRRALTGEYILLILDIGLPSVNGLEICKALRERSQQPLVIFVSSQVDEKTMLDGLDSGADDFLHKPFSTRELGARIRRLLRRRYHDQSECPAEPLPEKTESSGIVEYQDLVIDLDQRKVTIRGEEPYFTALEYSLLVYLIEHAGRAVSREELMQDVWGFNSHRFVNTVNSHVSRVRSKIEIDPDNPKYVFTVRGFGYQFASRDEAAKIVLR